MQTHRSGPRRSGTASSPLSSAISDGLSAKIARARALKLDRTCPRLSGRYGCFVNRNGAGLLRVVTVWPPGGWGTVMTTESLTSSALGDRRYSSPEAGRSLARSENEKIHVDASRPATLYSGAVSTDCPSLQKAVAVWHRLRPEQAQRATIRVIGGPLYTAAEIRRLHYGPQPA
jgi:hypothetical protein